ncbi:MAG TPA: MATE family efflux transporter [Polyangia bacterium]
MKPPAGRLDEFLARPRRAVWTVSAPMMAGMMLQVAFLVVETAFIGRLGETALAAMTLLFPLIFTIIAIINGVGTGITALIAQAIGRRDLVAAERIGGTAIAFGVILGLGFTAIGLGVGPRLVTHLGGTPTAAALAWSYFAVIALSAPLLFVGAFLRFLLFGEGDSRTPTVVMIAATLAQVGLDWLFIFRLGLGLRGAALAGAVAQSGMTAVMLYLLLVRRRNLVKLHWRALVPAWSTVRAVLAVGVPNSITQLLIAFGALLLNLAVASFGDAALAAFGVGTRVDQVAMMPVVGLASGSVSVIGMFAGAGRADLVRATSSYAIRWAVLIAGGIGVCAFAASVPFMRIFTANATTITVGRHYLMFMVFVYPLMAVVMMVARILLGLNYPNLSLLIVAVRHLALALPIAYVSVYVFHAPIDGVWWGLLIGTAGAMVVAVALLRRIVWRQDPTLRAVRKDDVVEAA